MKNRFMKAYFHHHLFFFSNAGHGDAESVDPNLLFDYKAFFCGLLPRKWRPARYNFEDAEEQTLEMKPMSGDVCFGIFCI